VTGGYDYAPGDRVTIVAPDHPWSGCSGTISGPMDAGKEAGWVVDLDDQAGLQCWAPDRELRTDRENEEERPPP